MEEEEQEEEKSVLIHHINVDIDTLEWKGRKKWKWNKSIETTVL